MNRFFSLYNDKKMSRQENDNISKSDAAPSEPSSEVSSENLAKPEDLIQEAVDTVIAKKKKERTPAQKAAFEKALLKRRENMKKGKELLLKKMEEEEKNKKIMEKELKKMAALDAIAKYEAEKKKIKLAKAAARKVKKEQDQKALPSEQSDNDDDDASVQDHSDVCFVEFDQVPTGYEYGGIFG